MIQRQNPCNLYWQNETLNTRNSLVFWRVNKPIDQLDESLFSSISHDNFGTLKFALNRAWGEIFRPKYIVFNRSAAIVSFRRSIHFLFWHDSICEIINYYKNYPLNFIFLFMVFVFFFNFDRQIEHIFLFRLICLGFFDRSHIFFKSQEIIVNSNMTITSLIKYYCHNMEV